MALEREKGGKKHQCETNTDLVASSMCPNRVSNPQPFRVQDDAPTESTSQGYILFQLSIFVNETPDEQSGIQNCWNSQRTDFA